jgi:L-serine dehydratase
MRAAKRFAQELEALARLARTQSVKVELYGSLALTGKGHGTDRAILLGLCGEEPDRIDPLTIEWKVSHIIEHHSLRLLGTHTIGFNYDTDFVLRNDEVLPGHINAMRFTAYDSEQRTLDSRVFYSVGGGFIVAQYEGPDEGDQWGASVPYPFESGADLLSFGRERNKSIWEMMWANEEVSQSHEDVRRGIFRFWRVMKDCMHQGMQKEGVLPGALKVQRRAPQLYRALSNSAVWDPLSTIDWINLFAIAVNEENAAGSRVVSAPTNGAAGVIPAVAQYYEKFVEGADDNGILRFFLTAGAVGILYKLKVPVCGAALGCQGEVGVACSMAAGGLVGALGGSNEQVEQAAEIGMEHTLGMTCDPLDGLVQIPCIDRNAFGAIKAVTSARIAMTETEKHRVSLDQVICTMLQTGRDMQSRYKKASLGGLTVNVIEC